VPHPDRGTHRTERSTSRRTRRPPAPLRWALATEFDPIVPRPLRRADAETGLTADCRTYASKRPRTRRCFLHCLISPTISSGIIVLEPPRDSATWVRHKESWEHQRRNAVIGSSYLRPRLRVAQTSRYQSRALANAGASPHSGNALSHFRPIHERLPTPGIETPSPPPPFCQVPASVRASVPPHGRSPDGLPSHLINR